MEKLPEKPRELIKKLGDRQTKGYRVKYGKKDYHYSYPENREIAKKLVKGDNAKIARLLPLSVNYIALVLNGHRFHEAVLIEAEKLGRYNEEMGYLPESYEIEEK